MAAPTARTFVQQILDACVSPDGSVTFQPGVKLAQQFFDDLENAWSRIEELESLTNVDHETLRQQIHRLELDNQRLATRNHEYRLGHKATRAFVDSFEQAQRRLEEALLDQGFYDDD